MPKIFILGLMAFFSATCSGTILSVMGGPSTTGLFAQIVSPPADVLPSSTTTNTAMWGFNERQGVVTTLDYGVMGGFIPAGTLVDSHMIFLHPAPSDGSLSHAMVTWVFSGNIVGVMSDTGGFRESASSFELGAPGTTYFGPAGPPYDGRGIEGPDYYIINGNMLTISLQAQAPGDFLRVVTSADIPEPSTWALMLSGLVLAALLRLRRA